MNSSLLFFSTVTKNSCKKQGHYNLLRGFATAPFFLPLFLRKRQKKNIFQKNTQNSRFLFEKKQFMVYISACIFYM